MGVLFWGYRGHRTVEKLGFKDPSAKISKLLVPNTIISMDLGT